MIYSRYNRPKQDGIVFDEASQTIQSVYSQTTIKYMIDRFKRTGILGDPLQTARARYLDTTKMPSFESLANKRALVISLFESLSPADRQKFSTVNDFVNYLTDNGNDAPNSLFRETHEILGADFSQILANEASAERSEAQAAEQGRLEPVKEVSGTATSQADQ